MGFKPETLETYKRVLDIFRNVCTHEGGNYCVSFNMFGGEVFLIHNVKSNGEHYYNIQYFGVPERFGFVIEPGKEIIGPYHFH